MRSLHIFYKYVGFLLESTNLQDKEWNDRK